MLKFPNVYYITPIVKTLLHFLFIAILEVKPDYPGVRIVFQVSVNLYFGRSFVLRAKTFIQAHASREFIFEFSISFSMRNYCIYWIITESTIIQGNFQDASKRPAFWFLTPLLPMKFFPFSGHSML